MPFGPVDPDLDLPALEERVLARWRERDVIAETARLRKGGEPWIFYEGPPTANGRPGLHHVWARVFKDLYPRFQTMRGRDVPRKGGWDCHGLPGRARGREGARPHATSTRSRSTASPRSTQRCRDVGAALRRGLVVADRAASAIWIDTADAYWTLDNDYIESVWWLVRQLWDKGLLYEGHQVVALLRPLRHRALESHELGQPGLPGRHRPVGLRALPAVGDGADADLLVWTTTPWTLISNVAAAVGPDIDLRPGRRARRRARPRAGRERPRAGVLGDDAEVVERGHRRRPGRAGATSGRSTFLDRSTARPTRVVAADFVTTDDGSGIVHLAPAFGEDDARGRPGRGPAGAQPGRRRRHASTTGSPPWHGPLREGRRPRDHRRPRAAGACSCASEPYEHTLPALLAVRHAAHLLGQDVVVRPHVRAPGRAAARERDDRLAPRAHQARPLRRLAREQRRLGAVPRPLLGHAAARLALPRLRPRHLRRLGGRAVASWPGATSPTSTCTARTSTTSPSPARRDGCDGHGPPAAAGARRLVRLGVDAVGPAPLPVRGRRTRFEAPFPADFICEAIDQTRGWFYSLLAVNTLVFGSTPYRNVVCLGHIVDEDGQKMSKSQGQRHRPVARSSTPSAPTRCAGTSSRPASRGRRAGCPRTASTSRPARRCSRSGTSSLLRHLRRPRRLGRRDRRRRAARRPTCSTAGCSASSTPPSPRSPTALEGFDALRRRHPRSPGSSTTSRTGTCAAAGPASGRPATRQAHATLHHVPRDHGRSCWPRSARSWPTSSTSPSPARRRSTWPTGRRPPGAADAGLAAQMAAARRLVALGRAARTDAKVKVRQPLRRALLLHPGVDARRRRGGRDRRRAQRQGRSRTSTRCRA